MKKRFLIVCMLLLVCVFPTNAFGKTTSPYLVSDGIPFLPKNKLANINNYTVYYGAGKIDELKKFDLDIIESANQSAENIKQLVDNQSKVLAYLSIGEAAPNEWYYPQVKKEWQLGENTTWGSMYIDVRNQGWHDLLLNTVIPEIQKKGVQGLFLDTVDTVDVEPNMADAMVNLIKEIREKYPNFIIVMNRGFTVMDQAIPYIDGIMFESFSSHIDWSTVDWSTDPPGGKYVTWDGADDQWTIDIAKRLGDWQKRTGLTILSLDYANQSDPSLIQHDYDRAGSFGQNLWDFVPYISTIDLEHVYNPPPKYSRNDRFQDTDGDGVVNAEELKFGLDPNRKDSFHNGKGDLFSYNALQVKDWAIKQKESEPTHKAKSLLTNISKRMDMLVDKPNWGQLESATSLFKQYQRTAQAPIDGNFQARFEDLSYLLKY